MKKQNLTLIGMAGSGKSTTGEYIADVLGWGFIDTDQLMQEEMGRSLQEILEEYGDDGFIRLEGAQVLKHAHVEHTVISPGGSVVYSFDAMNILQTISTIVYLAADPETIMHRIDIATRGIVGLHGDNFYDLYQERSALFTRFADHTIDTKHKSPEAVAKEILALESFA